MYEDFNIDDFKEEKQKILEEQHEKMIEADGVSANDQEEEESDSEEDSYMYGEYQCEQDENIDNYPSLKRQKSARRHRTILRGKK